MSFHRASSTSFVGFVELVQDNSWKISNDLYFKITSLSEWRQLVKCDFKNCSCLSGCNINKLVVVFLFGLLFFFFPLRLSLWEYPSSFLLYVLPLIVRRVRAVAESQILSKTLMMFLLYWENKQTTNNDKKTRTLLLDAVSGLQIPHVCLEIKIAYFCLHLSVYPVIIRIFFLYVAFRDRRWCWYSAKDYGYVV